MIEIIFVIGCRSPLRERLGLPGKADSYPLAFTQSNLRHPRPKLLTGKKIRGSINTSLSALEPTKMNIVRDVLCWVMIVFVPASLMAADSGVGMVRPYGTAWLNGAAVEQSSAIFPGDLVQTSSTSAMKIRSSGSSVTVLPDSLVKFEDGAVSVEHGGVKLATSKSTVARAGIVTATPASSARTEFELTDVDGTVQIVALKGDLQISNGSVTTILSEGQQATQQDSDKTQSKNESERKQSAPAPAAKKRTVVFIVAAADAAAVGGLALGMAELAPSSRVISPVAP